MNFLQKKERKSQSIYENTNKLTNEHLTYIFFEYLVVWPLKIETNKKWNIGLFQFVIFFCLCIFFFQFSYHDKNIRKLKLTFTMVKWQIFKWNWLLLFFLFICLYVCKFFCILHFFIFVCVYGQMSTIFFVLCCFCCCCLSYRKKEVHF